MMCSFITLPLITLAFDYSRIQRNSFIIMIIYMAMFFESKKLIAKEKRGFIIFSFIFLEIISGLVFCYMWPTFFGAIPKLIHI